jgi:hypothetical protein
VEPLNRTLESKLYKCFTRNNTYRYVDMSDNFVSDYNDAVDSSTGLAP